MYQVQKFTCKKNQQIQPFEEKREKRAREIGKALHERRFHQHTYYLKLHLRFILSVKNKKKKVKSFWS